MSPIEEKVTGLLAELAAARPVEVGTPPAAVSAAAHSGDRPSRPDYVPIEGPVERPRRRPVLVAAAVVLVLAVVGGLLVIGRETGRSPVVASLSDLPVDTSLLGDGRMAVVVENQLYVADGPTGQVWRLTDTGKGEEVSHVSFSHDGEWVAFTIHDESGLWISRWDGSERHRIGRSPSSYTWSPTDDRLAYATQDEVRIAQTDGTSRALTGGPTPLPYTNVAWSPDGQSLAFARGSYPGQGGLVTVTPQGADDPGWGKPFQYSPSADVVYAWPLEGVTVSAVGQGRGQLQADLLLSVRSQALTDVMTNTLPDPVDVSGATVVVVSPDGGEVRSCDLVSLGCSYLAGLSADRSYVDPSLTPSGGRLAIVGGLVGSDLFVVDLGTGETTDLGQVSTGPWGTYGGDVSRGVGTEAPVWIDDQALLIRVDSSSVVRVDASTGQRSTVVLGERFLPPADDYPGGTGLAYWAPR